MARRGGAATGRGLKKAWIASKPHRTTARKTTGRGLKRAAGAAWDATRALASGARAWVSAKKGERKSAAWARIREMWTKRRKTRAEKAAAKAAAAEASKTPPEVGTTVRRPTTTTIPATFTGGTAVSGGHHFVAPAMEAARAAANYQPTGMMQVGQDFAGLQQALELNAEAMKVTVENADTKFPLDPRIVETMRQIHSLQLKAAELASELQPAFRKFHDVDIARIENPRKGREGERMWDVSANL